MVPVTHIVFKKDEKQTVQVKLFRSTSWRLIGVQVGLNPFVTSALDIDKQSASRLGCFISGREVGTREIGSWVVV
jgi:hypothetical protein